MQRDPERVIEPQPQAAAATASPATLAIAALATSDIAGRLTPDRLPAALSLIDWLASPRQREEGAGTIVAELCERFLRAGLPLDRYGSATTMVTADSDAIGRLWWRGKGVEETVYVGAGDRDPSFLASPFHAASSSGTWVELRLPETPDERFGVVAEFKAEGLVHYICVPLRLTNGADGWITFATKQVTGFSEQDLLTIAFVLPALMMRIDARVGWLSLDKFLRTYVGDEPHKAILAGRAKRGQVMAITAAMLVADLRDSTGLMADLGALQAVDAFNALFDCLVPNIETRQGEVLKYLGDGLLAIFRDEGSGRPASDRALAAAEAALDAVTAHNAAEPHRRPMEIGIALHFGEVAYGNVGSGSRLDFTVIGRDVALATRVAGMNGPLGKPLLWTEAFGSRVGRPGQPLGAFPARGFAEPLEVFEPAPARVRSTA